MILGISQILSAESEDVERLKQRINELNDELNNRCTELEKLREEVAKLSQQSFEYGKRVGYHDGYRNGWAAAQQDTEWNIE